MRTENLTGAGRNESVSRAFRVLAVVASSQGAGVAVHDVAHSTGLPRSTTLRTLATLLELGAVIRQPDKTWAIGPLLAQLSRPTSPILRIPEECHRFLEELAESTGESSMLAIPTGPASARTIDEVEGTNLLGVRSRWAGRVVDHSASGYVRTLLAELPEAEIRRRLEHMEHPKRTPYTLTTVDALTEAILQIQRQQHSAVTNELEEGVAGVGVSIRSSGTIVGLLAVYLPTTRFSPETHQTILTAMFHTAEQITTAMAQIPA